jgi:hypothetical protein
MLCLAAVTSLQAQSVFTVDNAPSITVTSVKYTSSRSSVLTTATTTVTNGALDTAYLKVTGGTHANSLHFWNVGTKVSGTTDSVTITIYGSVDTGTVTPGSWKSLYSDQTANSSSAQVFEHIIANDYTNYMIVTGRMAAAIGAQVSSWKKKVLIR